tara:strand:+ start:2386 stop:2946 length:561 start_codon:yes stop_codon:yes gene_type:complete
MGIIREDFKYKKIENFFSKDEVAICDLYCEMKHRTNLTSFMEDGPAVPRAPYSYFYADPLMESIMLKKKPLMEKETGKKLLATYSFWKIYTKFLNLPKHTDKPACEISVTVNISSDVKNYPIYMDGNRIDLNPGDAVIYLGCEVEHYREEFKGDWCTQVFMHYVDAEGPYSSLEKEGRPYWGVQKN